MRLADFEQLSELAVWRDCEFVTLGFISNPVPGMLTFLEEERFLGGLRSIQDLAGVITTAELASKLEHVSGLAVCPVPRKGFYTLHNHLAQETDVYWQDFPSQIDPSARIHPRAFVSERNVRIGADTVVGPNATILERSLLGRAVKVGAGAVVGSEGYQSLKVGERLVELVHAGGIVIEDAVSLRPQSVIARGTFSGCTSVGSATHVGNLAYVSHDAQIGRCCRIGHGSVINGYVQLGDEVTIGPLSVLAHHVRLGDGARVSPGSAVIGDVPSGRWVTGNIAIPHQKYLRSMARARS